MKIQGAVALVTGAARGIGRAFCYALLENNVAAVEMVDISKTEGEKLQNEFESQFGAGRAKFAECDVTCKESLSKVIHEAVRTHGQLNILCNNAGIGDETNWEKALAVNLVSVINGTQIGLEVMTSGGLIVNTSSMAGLEPLVGSPVYAATKHGVVGYTRSIAPIALKRKGIRINCLCPSFVSTPLIDAFLQTYRGKALTERFGLLRPETVAQGLLQLIEDESRNGAVMRITNTKGIDFKQYRDYGDVIQTNQ